MKYVAQEEFMGCVIACMAMISEESYWDVKQHLSHWPDVGSVKGISVEFQAVSYLFERFGYVSHTMYPTIGYLQKQRGEGWIKPFAPIHIVSVQTTGTHAVIMDENGIIKDPNRGDVEFKLEDYKVNNITGFWKI